MELKVKKRVLTLEDIFPQRGCEFPNHLYLPGYSGTIDLEATTKQYVDGRTLNLSASQLTQGAIDTARLPDFTGAISKPEGSDTITLPSYPAVAGNATKLLVDAYGRVTQKLAFTDSDIPDLNWRYIQSGLPNTAAGYGITDALTATGGTMTGALSVLDNSGDPHSLLNKLSLEPLVAPYGLKTGTHVRKAGRASTVGYLKADGRDVQISEYSDLYAIIGNTFSQFSSAGCGLPSRQLYQIADVPYTPIDGWSTGANLPSNVFAGEAIVTKKRVYILGGNSSLTSGTIRRGVYTAVVNADGSLGGWSSATNLPLDIATFGLAAINNHVYLLGGNNDGTVRSSIYRSPINSDGTLGSWSLIGDLPYPVYNPACVVTQNRLYIIGGRDQFGGAIATVCSALTHTDGSLGSWSYSDDLPVTLHGSALAVVGNFLYLLGGNNGWSATTDVYRAQIDASGLIGTFTSYNTLPTWVQDGRAVATRNRLYLVGGGVLNWPPQYRGRVFSATVNESGDVGIWEEETALPNDIAGMQVFVTSSRLYVIGGRDDISAFRATYYTDFSGGLNDYSAYYGASATYTPDGYFRLPTVPDTEPYIGTYIKT